MLSGQRDLGQPGGRFSAAARPFRAPGRQAASGQGAPGPSARAQRQQRHFAPPVLGLPAGARSPSGRLGPRSEFPAAGPGGRFGGARTTSPSSRRGRAGTRRATRPLPVPPPAGGCEWRGSAALFCERGGGEPRGARRGRGGDPPRADSALVLPRRQQSPYGGRRHARTPRPRPRSAGLAWGSSAGEPSSRSSPPSRIGAYGVGVGSSLHPPKRKPGGRGHVAALQLLLPLSAPLGGPCQALELRRGSGRFSEFLPTPRTGASVQAWWRGPFSLAKVPLTTGRVQKPDTRGVSCRAYPLGAPRRPAP